MRVLMLSDLYPPFIGGVEQHVRNLGLGLIERGHDVSVATMSHADLPEHEVDAGMRVYRLRGSAQRIGGVANPGGRPYSPPFPDPEVVQGLWAIIAHERPTIVHGHNWLVRSFMPLKRRSRAGLVVTLHNYGIVCAKQSFLFGGEPCSGPGMVKCLRCAAGTYGAARGVAITLGNWAIQPWHRSTVDMFLAVSNAVAEGNELASRGLPFEVLPNFVPDDVAAQTDPTDPALAKLPSGPYWLYVGALSRHKGIHVLLDAYRELSSPPPLVLIGSPWHDTPKRFPANTTVLHSLPHPAVMAAWQRATLGIVPSVFPDPCPTVAMEAMACGVPLVASRIGGLPDLVTHGQTGLLVKHSHRGELQEALSTFMADPDLSKRMAPVARQRVASFTASSVIDRLEGVYSKVATKAT
jgi:glycosyltransferase involved in cell wall biosynthesis